MEILNVLIKPAGWTIIHSLWQGAVLYAGLNIILILNKKLSSNYRHNLYFLTQAGIFLWASVTFYTEVSSVLLLNNASSNFPVTRYSISGEAGPDIPSEITYKVEQIIPILVCFYAIGLSLHIISLFYGYFKIKSIKTTGLSDISNSLVNRFSHLVNKMGVKRKVRFYISSKVSVPLVTGYFKPMILLPLSAVTHLDIQQLEAVIIHELSHIRRNDYLLNILKIAIETVLFFNPFVLLTGRKIDAEREHACDDLVVAAIGDPMMYIETLVQLQELKNRQNQFAMAITGKNFLLLNRIKRIADNRSLNFNVKRPFSALLILIVFISLAWTPLTEMHKSKVKKVEAVEKPRPTRPKQLPVRVTSLSEQGHVTITKRRKDGLADSYKREIKNQNTISLPEIEIDVTDQSPHVYTITGTDRITTSADGHTFSEKSTNTPAYNVKRASALQDTSSIYSINVSLHNNEYNQVPHAYLYIKTSGLSADSAKSVPVIKVMSGESGSPSIFTTE